MLHNIEQHIFLKVTSQIIPVNKEMIKKCWCWIEHRMRKPVNSITRESFHWSLLGIRYRGISKNTDLRKLETGE